MNKRLKNFRSGLVLKKSNTLRCMAPPTNWTPPAYVDGKPLLLPADDQGQTPACTGFGMAGVCEALHWWATGVRQTFDGLKLYRHEKELDGNNQDGSTLDQALVAAADFDWLSFKNPEGKTVTVDIYDLTTPDQIRYALHRCPVILFGFQITDAWMSPKRNGTLANSKKIVGGHCVAGAAYDNYGVDICNCWGTRYGVEGHIRLSWAQVKQQMFAAKGFLIRVG